MVRIDWENVEKIESVDKCQHLMTDPVFIIKDAGIAKKLNRQLAEATDSTEPLATYAVMARKGCAMIVQAWGDTVAIGFDIW